MDLGSLHFVSVEDNLLTIFTDYEAYDLAQNETTGFLSGLFSARTNLLNIVFVAVLASLGINLIAIGIIGYSSFSPILTIQVGSILCIIPIVYFLLLLVRQRRKIRRFEGFILLTKQKNVVSVFRYNYSEELEGNLRGAFVENNELKELWDLSLDKALETSARNWKTYSARWQPISKIVIEATEYYIIDKLGTHLSKYFNEKIFQKDDLQEIVRKDIPHVLLANRFLELFSRPMNERSKFMEPPNDSKPEIIEEDDKIIETKREVIYRINQGGAFYRKFTLLLPKQSKVTRDSNGRLRIDTRRFTVTIEIDFRGFGTILPPYFIERYVGLREYVLEGKHFDELVKSFQIDIIVSVEFKFGALLTPTGWEYYKWIDSFLDSLDADISTSRFLREIAWNTTASFLKCLDNDKVANKKDAQTK